MEDFAQELSKEKADQRNKLRKEYLAYIMKERFYPAKEKQFEEWPIVALKHEADRIDRIKNDPRKKKTAPNWSKYKKLIADLTSEYKRKKQELVDAKVDTATAIAKWSKQHTDEAYERLKKRRITVSDTSKKPDYKKLEQQIENLKTLLTSADNPILVSNQEEGKQLSSEEVKEKEAEYFTETIKKMGLKEESSVRLQDLFKKVLTKPASPSTSKISDIEPDQQKRQEQIEKETAEDVAAANDVIEKALKQMSDSLQLFTRPTSPNSSGNKSLPRNPLGLKVLKWMSDQKTHILTLVRSNGKVKYISRKEALGLSVEDLQDLLELSLCMDEDDSSSKDFEEEFKRQAKELLMRNKNPE
ncbi:hypothetical protein HanIR_Chr13g0632251 [Helianthus annuus]|nr:hypothetical protein HanIR_Chr13g0632251 [Helianthus annuus]